MFGISALVLAFFAGIGFTVATTWPPQPSDLVLLKTLEAYNGIARRLAAVMTSTSIHTVGLVVPGEQCQVYNVSEKRYTYISETLRTAGLSVTGGERFQIIVKTRTGALWPVFISGDEAMTRTCKEVIAEVDSAAERGHDVRAGVTRASVHHGPDSRRDVTVQAAALSGPDGTWWIDAPWLVPQPTDILCYLGATHSDLSASYVQHGRTVIINT